MVVVSKVVSDKYDLTLQSITYVDYIHIYIPYFSFIHSLHTCHSFIYSTPHYHDHTSPYQYNVEHHLIRRTHGWLCTFRFDLLPFSLLFSLLTSHLTLRHNVEVDTANKQAQAQVTASGTMGVTNPPQATMGTSINQTSDSRLLSVNSIDDL